MGIQKNREHQKEDKGNAVGEAMKMLLEILEVIFLFITIIAMLGIIRLFWKEFGGPR